MSTKINARQAHDIADQNNSANYTTFLSETHSSVKRAAEQGLYKKSVDIPVAYTSKTISILSYFRMFGFRVSTTPNRRLHIEW